MCIRGHATLAHARGRPPHCIRGQATLAHARGRPPDFGWSSQAQADPYDPPRQKLAVCSHRFRACSCVAQQVQGGWVLHLLRMASAVPVAAATAVCCCWLPTCVRCMGAEGHAVAEYKDWLRERTCFAAPPACPFVCGCCDVVSGRSGCNQGRSRSKSRTRSGACEENDPGLAEPPPVSDKAVRPHSCPPPCESLTFVASGDTLPCHSMLYYTILYYTILRLPTLGRKAGRTAVVLLWPGFESYPREARFDF